MCPHAPACPSAQAVDHDAARVVADHPEQGWRLLCNGVVRFDDTGELMPDGHAAGPQCRPLPRATLPRAAFPRAAVPHAA